MYDQLVFPRELAHLKFSRVFFKVENNACPTMKSQNFTRKCPPCINLVFMLALTMTFLLDYS